jgi:hypothetical protein
MALIGKASTDRNFGMRRARGNLQRSLRGCIVEAFWSRRTTRAVWRRFSLSHAKALLCHPLAGGRDANVWRGLDFGKVGFARRLTIEQLDVRHRPAPHSYIEAVPENGDLGKFILKTCSGRQRAIAAADCRRDVRRPNCAVNWLPCRVSSDFATELSES